MFHINFIINFFKFDYKYNILISQFSFVKFKISVCRAR